VPNDAASLLSKRGERWLKTSLYVLCEAEAIEVPAWNSLESVAQAIVDIITRRPSLPPWNGDCITSGLKGSTELPEYAARVHPLHKILSDTTVSDWVARYLGHSYGNTNFLESALSSADLSILLRNIAEPIEQLFIKQRYDFTALVEHIMILETRFDLKRCSSVVNWSETLSVDFSIWRSISTKTPQTLAESTTQGMEKLFAGISLEHLNRRDGRVKDIGREWTDFYVDILASLNAGASVEYIKELAEVRQNLCRIRR
jgi:hypothetical protein